MRQRTAYIEGIGVWAPVLPSWEEACPILRGEVAPPPPATRRPSPELLPANERRRAPDTVAISLEVARKACVHAGRDPTDLPSVFCSTHGDLAVTDYMCETLAQSPTLVSPTKFHNSVHNAAAGYWAIATGCTKPYTAISASGYSFGAGLLEALVQSESSGESILYVAYDIQARGALATVVKSEGQFGCAMVLNALPSARAKYAIEWETIGSGHGDSAAANQNTPFVAGNAMAAALPVLQALANEQGRCTVSLGATLALQLNSKLVDKKAGQPVP